MTNQDFAAMQQLIKNVENSLIGDLSERLSEYKYLTFNYDDDKKYIQAHYYNKFGEKCSMNVDKIRVNGYGDVETYNIDLNQWYDISIFDIEEIINLIQHIDWK